MAERTDTSSVRPAAMQTRVYLAMWTTHLRDLTGGLLPNSLIGFAYRGYYAGTFINSYGDRAVVAGMQRSFSTPRSGSLTTAIGYRAGVLTGYDERFLGIGDKIPALPFFQLVGTVDYRRVGVELAYSGIVASVIVNLRL